MIDLRDDINKFLSDFPDFNCVNQSDNFILKGNLQLNHEYSGTRFNKLYQLKIIILKDISFIAPQVYETSGAIKKNYAHLYPDKSLCLASVVELFDYFSAGKDLSSWMDDFVYPYFFSYEFFQQYKVYPFGERSHGNLGNIEYYQDKFNLNDITDTLNILKYIAKGKYRGHIDCPCYSGKKLRDCHKDDVQSNLISPNNLIIKNILTNYLEG